MMHRWKAHADCINWVTYVPELDLVTSCSFDCNVYMWDTNGIKIGSLVLGMEKLWKISVISITYSKYLQIDKRTKNDEEKREAEYMLQKVSYFNYETMFSKQKKVDKENMQKVLEKDKVESQMVEQMKYEGLNEEERNKMILNEM